MMDKVCWVFLLLRCELRFLGTGLLDSWGFGVIFESAIIKLRQTIVQNNDQNTIVHKSPKTKTLTRTGVN